MKERHIFGLHTDLAGRILDSLSPVLGWSPSIVSDSPTLVDWFCQLGCRAFDFRHADAVPAAQREGVVAITTDNTTIPSYEEWYRLFRDSRVLLIPLVSFDPSLDAAIYTAELLARSHFEAAVVRNSR